MGKLIRDLLVTRTFRVYRTRDSERSFNDPSCQSSEAETSLIISFGRKVRDSSTPLRCARNDKNGKLFSDVTSFDIASDLRFPLREIPSRATNTNRIHHTPHRFLPDHNSCG
jgi:hypothetical protein